VSSRICVCPASSCPLVLFSLHLRRNVEGTGNTFIGNFHNGYSVFKDTKPSKCAIELNNGRVVMLSSDDLMVHEEIAPLGYDLDLIEYIMAFIAT
jgi:hypothetical protein